MVTDAERATARAAEAAAAAAAADSNGGGGGGGSAAGGMAEILRRLDHLSTLPAAVLSLSARVGAMELGREAAPIPPEGRPPPPGVPPPLAPGHPPAEPGLAAAIAEGIAQGMRQQKEDKDNSASIRDDLFTDDKAKKLVSLTTPLTYFSLPECARTDYPAPYRVETLRFQADWGDVDREEDADEAAHLTILGAWSSKMHNEIQEMCSTPAIRDLASCQSMLLRARVYLHQLAELCACRYDVLREGDADVAAAIQSRILGPADQHASKALGTFLRDVRAERNKDLVNQVAAGQKRGKRARRGKGAKPLGGGEVGGARN